MSWDEFLMSGNRQSGTQTVKLQLETGCSCSHCERHNIYLKYCIIYSPAQRGPTQRSHYECDCVKCFNTKLENYGASYVYVSFLQSKLKS